MLNNSQDVLYITVSICVATFTFFLVWIMYYVAQISRQSNEMIADFREKMEELDESIQDIKEKVSTSVDSLATVSEQVGNIMEVVRGFSSKAPRKRVRRKRKSDEA